MECHEAPLEAILHPEATDPYGFPTDSLRTDWGANFRFLLLARQQISLGWPGWSDWPGWLGLIRPGQSSLKKNNPYTDSLRIPYGFQGRSPTPEILAGNAGWAGLACLAWLAWAC